MAHSLSTYLCSPQCQAVHVACLGCGVLAGPEHVHVLRDGYCAALIARSESGAVSLVPAFQSCWSVRHRAPTPDEEPELELPLPDRRLPRLRALRESRGYSQEALARLAGLSRPTLSHLEAGMRGAQPSTVERLARALDVDPRDLLAAPPVSASA